MQRETPRRAFLALSGATAGGLAGCLRLQEGETGGEESEGNENSPISEGGDGDTTESPDSQEGDTDETEIPEDFKIDLTASWELEDGISDVLTADGDFFVRPHRTNLKRFGSDGTEQFSYGGVPEEYRVVLRRGRQSAFQADPSGVYVGTRPSDESEGGRVYALDPDTSEERWTFEEPADGRHDAVSGMTRVGDLLIFVSQSDGSGSDQEPIVRALDVETGREEWRMERSGEFVTGITAFEDRLFVQETFHYYVYDRSTRDLLDDQRLHIGFNAPTRLGETVYFGRETLKAFDLSSDEERWSVDSDREANTPPGVGDLGVFFGTEAGFLFGCDRETGENLWEERVEGVIGHQPIVEDGVVWIADERGTLSGFNERTGERLYSEDISPGFSFAVQDGILLDTERATGFDIERS